MPACWRAAVLISLAAPCLAADQSPNQLTEAEKAHGWRLPFDGKSLAGWDDKHGGDAGNYWRVEDGNLRTVAAEAGRDLFTESRFRDFEPSVEWKVSPGGNSGVYHNFYDTPQSPRMLRWFTARP